MSARDMLDQGLTSRVEYAALEAINVATAALFDAPAGTPAERKAASDARDELDGRRRKVRAEHADATAMLLQAVEDER